MPKAISSAVKDDAFWMARALALARKSAEAGEVPIGAVAVLDGKKVASAYNLSIRSNDPTAHAEIVCLRKAARSLRNYRLADIILYVTKEPCAMCAGALVWARVKRVVFGCRDSKAGALGSVMDLSKAKGMNHRFETAGGVLEKECRAVLRRFFQDKR